MQSGHLMERPTEANGRRSADPPATHPRHIPLAPALESCATLPGEIGGRVGTLPEVLIPLESVAAMIPQLTTSETNSSGLIVVTAYCGLSSPHVCVTLSHSAGRPSTPVAAGGPGCLSAPMPWSWRPPQDNPWRLAHSAGRNRHRLSTAGPSCRPMAAGR